MRVLVFGAGAMGSFFGGLLAARHDVTLVGRDDHVKAIRRSGLRISGKTSRIATARAVTSVPRGAKADIVIVSTKAYDTRAAMRPLARYAGASLFLTVQNGFGNADVIARTAHRVVVGTTAHGVTLLEPGHVRHAGIGETVIGPWANVGEEDLVRLRDVLDDVGIVTRIASDIRTELWAKLVMNAAINPLAALAGVPNGRLVRDRRLAEALEAVVREAAAVARAAGASTDPTDLYRRTVLVARRTAVNRCSMLQDLDRGRRTEVDAITGAIVRAAARHGLHAPINALLYALVRAREAEGLPSPSRGRGREEPL
ncbi:MAG: ketopantoate reductase family protein [Methanobacteriota archaeon]